MTIDVDAVVAGGGVAGSAAAAALEALGWSVLLIDPGQDAGRRLAGELIHPAGVDGLRALGLLGESGLAAAVRLDGFAVFPDARVDQCVHLPYRATGAGGKVAMALDHVRIIETLLATLAARSAVSVLRGARVVELDNTGELPVVRFERGGGSETVRCRLVVAADGASSSVRGLAGIRHRRRREALITGCVVYGSLLPFADRAHVFAARGPVLAYGIGGDRVRVLLNQPLGSAQTPLSTTELEGVPEPLRAAIADAMAGGPIMRFTSTNLAVETVTRGRVVTVGDAAGSCHPITASGMTMSIEDACRLAAALRRSGGEVQAALESYARQRQARQRARVLLATTLHEVLGGSAPEMRLMRAGLIRYWRARPRARAASMALLGMQDLRVRSILGEMLLVALAGVTDPLGEPITILRRLGLLARLPQPLIRHVIDAIRIR